MNNNLLNVKRDRSKESKEIILTLEKSGSNNFRYLSDSLNERSKIKIPLLEEKNLELKNNHQPDKNLKIQLKSNERSLPVNKITNTNQGNLSIPSQEKKHENEEKHKIILPEEIPILQKYVEKNSKQNLIIPSCAQWFNFDGIHDIETRSLPEFFCGVFPSKTPEIYKEYRNYIIDLFRENTNSYLSSSCKLN